jgi:cysteinyl-tRNA synthetase
MIKILNTISGEKEELLPLEENKIKIFVCGPTVYDYIHIGNARTFVFFDVVVKYLRYVGYDVNYIQNITDIDDKIIKQARENNKDPLEWAREYEQKFLEDIKNLGINAVSRYARATDHIDQVIKQVNTLKEKGHAYLIEEDGWYFDLKTFPEYGKLSKRTTQMADDAVSRIDESNKKRNIGDFALWKISKEKEPAWDTELGKGRPGWHIEDTAITEYYFGPQYDIHGGGQDLIFPHHEAEIAQQESASGKKPFVKYWMHVGFVINKDQKMSKSLGNFKTTHELLKKYSKEVLRFYLLSGHYRSPLDFNEDILKQAEGGVNRLYEFMQKLNLVGQGTKDYQKDINQKINDFKEAMNDDFNTPKSIAAVFELIKNLNPYLSTNSLNKESVEKVKNFFTLVNNILGIIPQEQEKIPSEILKLIEEREKLRKNKNFKESDRIRAQIENLGYQVEDTNYGPIIKKLDSKKCNK